MATFKAGQKVAFKGMAMPATIISGPHPTHGAERWLIRKADETVSLVRERELTPILTRTEAAAKSLYESARGGAWDSAPSYVRQSYMTMAERALRAADKFAADTPVPLAVGDKIRIMVARHQGSRTEEGDVLSVLAVDGGRFLTNAPRSGLVSYWTFYLDQEGKGWTRA